MNDKDNKKEKKEFFIRGEILDKDLKKKFLLVSLTEEEEKDDSEKKSSFEKRFLVSENTSFYKIEIEIDENKELVSESEREEVSFDDVVVGDKFITTTDNGEVLKRQDNEEVKDFKLQEIIIIRNKTKV